MAGLAAAFQEDLIRQEFDFCLRGDFLCCVRHRVNLLRTALYACCKKAAYTEDGKSRADTRYLDFRGVAFVFERLRAADRRRTTSIVLRAGRWRRRERRVSCSMEWMAFSLMSI